MPWPPRSLSAAFSMLDAVNRGAKANRELTDRVKVSVETLMTGTSSRNARASAVRRSPKEAAGKLLARRT